MPQEVMNLRIITDLSLLSFLWLPVSCTGPAGTLDSKSIVLAVPPPSSAVHYSIPTSAGPDDLARLAIRHHPSIAAARHRAQGLAEKIPQENALPDPMLELTAGPVLGKSMNGREAMLELQQALPFPGKRREAVAAASRDATAAFAEIRTLELNLTEQVHSAWWDLYLSDQTSSLTRESRSVLEAIRDAVDARVAANQASQSDQLRLSSEITMVDRDLAEASELQRTARARLNSLLNRPAGAPLPTARTAKIPSTASLDSLLAQAQSRHPEVAAAQERANAFQHRLRRAELEKYPDFTVGVTGSSNDEVFGMVGITLPIWQQPRRAMIREAREGIAETEAMIAATRADLRYRIEEAWYRVKTAREITRLFETRLIPDAQQAYEVTLTGYSAGSNSFTDLVETWRQIITYRLQLANTQAQLGKATATLRAAAAIY
jgi:outer membrane protein, heavy metal efflux system